MSLLRRIAKLERPNLDKFDTRRPTSWQEFYARILNDGPVSQSAPALTAAEAWAACSRALSLADDESIVQSWHEYLLIRQSWR
jgi:hypothetical protein